MSDPSLDRLVERMLEGDEHSQRDFIRRLAGTGFAVSGAGAFLAACGGVKGESSGQSADLNATAIHP